MTSTVDAAAAAALPFAGLQTGLYINGRWHPAESGRTFEVENPATGQTLATVSDGGASDAMRAIQAAAGTQKSWAAAPPREHDARPREYRGCLPRRCP